MAGANGRLQPHHGPHTGDARAPGEVHCFGGRAPERPLAEHHLAGVDRRRHELVVFGHLHRHDDQVDARVRDQVLRVVERVDAEGVARGRRRLGPARADRLEPELGQRPQCRQVRARRPPWALWTGPDDAHANR